MFFIPKTSINILFCDLFTIIFSALLFFINRKKFITFLSRIFKLKVIKIYSLFIAYIVINTIVHFFMGYSRVEWYGNIFYFISYFCTLILIFLYPLFGLYIKASIKTILKIIYIMIFATLLIGFVEWFALKYNISIINSIIDFFTNQRYGYDEIEYVKPRIHSLYREPSVLASFIFTIFPFVFNFYYLKNKLFKNNWFNLIFKLTLMPLTMIVLFMTESPVYIPVTLIEFVLLFFMQYKNKILNPRFILNISIVFLFGMTLILFLSKIDFFTSFKSDGVITRIGIAMESMTDFNKLSVKENSLATRIQSGIMQWNVFKENPIFGVGVNFGDSYAARLFIKISGSIPMTLEMWERYHVCSYLHLNFTIFWKMLAECGIIGTFLYFWFFFLLIKISFSIKKYYQGIEYSFIESLQYSILTIALFSNLYNERMERTLFWVLYGLILMFYYKLKFQKKQTLFLKRKGDSIQDK